MFSLLITLTACTPEDPWIPPGGGFSNNNSSNSTDSAEDTNEPAEEPSSEPSIEVNDADFQVGDPISFMATWPQQQGNHQGPMREWTDATIYNDQYAIQVGVSGVSIVSRDNGEVIHDSPDTSLVYRVDTDGEIIIVGSRTKRLSFWEIQNEQLQIVHTIEENGTHEDVAIADGIAAVTWRDDSLKLYHSDGSFITSVSAEDPFTVDIFEDKIVYTDKTNLILLDISNPASPEELDRIEMPAEGRDSSWNGEFVAVGLGGNGVATYRVENNRFIEHDEFMFDGAALSVALDGEYLWTATWSSVWISWLGETQAFHLGQETPRYSAMGLAVEGGRAIIADWYQSSVMHHNPGVWGPEITIPKEMFYHSQDGQAFPLALPNYSSLDLTVTFSPPNEMAMNIDSVTIAPGKTEYVRFTPTTSNPGNIHVGWTSNDPDEASNQLRLMASSSAVGSEHVDFDLPLVTAEQGISGSARLSDYEGKILFLAWWAEF